MQKLLPEFRVWTYLNAECSNVREYVKDISERMQCPPDFAAVNLYVMLGEIIGCKIGLRPKQKTTGQLSLIYGAQQLAIQAS